MSNLPMTLNTDTLPAPQKSAIRKWWDSANGAQSAVVKAKEHAIATANGLRGAGEGVLLGGALGAADAMLPTGLDYKKVPLDAVLAGLAVVGSAALGANDAGHDARNVATSASAIFGFRKARDFAETKMVAKGKIPGFVKAKAAAATPAKVAGDYGNDDYGAEDPIVAAARYL